MLMLTVGAGDADEICFVMVCAMKVAAWISPVMCLPSALALRTSRVGRSIIHLLWSMSVGPYLISGCALSQASLVSQIILLLSSSSYLTKFFLTEQMICTFWCKIFLIRPPHCSQLCWGYVGPYQKYLCILKDKSFVCVKKDGTRAVGPGGAY